MNGYIYMLIDKRNGKKYIGKHNGKNNNYYTGGKIPRLIIKKYGNNVFEKIFLEKNISNLIELSEREKHYIKLYDTFKNGYNLTEGGDGGGEWIYKKTDEEKKIIKEKKSKWNKENKIVSEETKEKLRKAHTGKKLSLEHKVKVIEVLNKNRLKFHTPETKEKLRQIHLGLKASEETKKKMSATRKGKSIPGMSERLRENNPKAQKVSIKGEIYKTIRFAAEVLNMREDTVRARINSKSARFIDWKRV